MKVTLLVMRKTNIQDPLLRGGKSEALRWRKGEEESPAFLPDEDDDVDDDGETDSETDSEKNV